MRVALGSTRRLWSVLTLTLIAAIAIVAGISSQAAMRASEIAASPRRSLNCGRLVLHSTNSKMVALR